ncbi:Spy/CpxP family protein refolding chaperone [Aquabacterium sp.]|uniref:Spy/CpxP family protein refolding chaperone n=1 Tax=Aquabacterium sp. TaxID=1872578 RepID=UPI003D6CAA85
MNPFHALVHAHRRHSAHHHHRHEDGASSFADHLAGKLSHRLDLNGEQQAKLETLLSAVQQQRQALRREALFEDITGLLAGSTLDRAATRQLVDERLATAQAAVPALVDALADFYDTLDAEQQQALRFVMRLRRRGFGRFGRRGEQ